MSGMFTQFDGGFIEQLLGLLVALQTSAALQFLIVSGLLTVFKKTGKLGKHFIFFPSSDICCSVSGKIGRHKMLFVSILIDLSQWGKYGKVVN
jgi:hypothetical protein